MKINSLSYLMLVTAGYGVCNPAYADDYGDQNENRTIVAAMGHSLKKVRKNIEEFYAEHTQSVNMVGVAVGTAAFMSAIYGIIHSQNMKKIDSLHETISDFRGFLYPPSDLPMVVGTASPKSPKSSFDRLRDDVQSLRYEIEAGKTIERAFVRLFTDLGIDNPLVRNNQSADFNQRSALERLKDLSLVLDALDTHVVRPAHSVIRQVFSYYASFQADGYSGYPDMQPTHEEFLKSHTVFHSKLRQFHMIQENIQNRLLDGIQADSKKLQQLNEEFDANVSEIKTAVQEIVRIAVVNYMGQGELEVYKAHEKLKSLFYILETQVRRAD